MSLETQIASLVTAANNLTSAVDGKMGQIDQEIVGAKAAFEGQLNDLKRRLPRLLITKNFPMLDNDGNGIPDGFGINAEVMSSLVMVINNVSASSGRTQAEVNKLAEIEADVRELYPDFDIRKYDHYRDPIAVWKFQWSSKTPESGEWLIYPITANNSSDVPAIPANSYYTMGAFVRVLEGGVQDAIWTSGWAAGKWRWCSAVLAPGNHFNAYNILHPFRTTVSGTVEVCCLGVVTGIVDHPGAWGNMLEINGG